MDSNVTIGDKKVSFDPPKVIVDKTIPTKRKFSFPVSLHSNLLGISDGGAKDLARRRFSNVGDVVSRKLSNTIGWRTPAIPTEEIIAQGKVLCGQYIRNRLKRSGIFSRKLGLYRLRSTLGETSGLVVREVFPGLSCACVELERMYPKLYTNVARQSSLAPGGILVSDKATSALFSAIGHDLLKNGINWGKVVSLFSVAGGLAVDCVYQNHPEYMHGLMEGMMEVMECGLGEWIATNGGWTALSAQCQTTEDEVSFVGYTSFVLLGVGLLFFAYLVIRFFGKFVFL